MNKQLIESIKRHEGLSLTAYKCTLGKLTIGYGHYLEDDVITEKVAEQMLHDDLLQISKELNYSLLDKYCIDLDFLPFNVKNVLVEMAFQLGVTGLLKFQKTMEYIRLRIYPLAAKEMLDSKWARQTPDRARELSNLMKGGN